MIKSVWCRFHYYRKYTSQQIRLPNMRALLEHPVITMSASFSDSTVIALLMCYSR